MFDPINTSSELQIQFGQTGSAASTPASHDVVVIDTSVEDYQTLLSGVKDGVEVIEINGVEDGLSAIADALSGRTDITSLQIISHGSEGQVRLGSDVLNEDTLDDHAAVLAQIADSLADGADVLLYGCSVATNEGLGFIEALAARLGADVAASDDLTGATSRGGDWELEVQTGDIEADIPFTEAALADFSNLLVDITFDLSTASDNGAIITETVSGYTASFVNDNDMGSGGDSIYVDISNFYITLGGAIFDPQSITLKSYFGSRTLTFTTDVDSVGFTATATYGVDVVVDLSPLSNNATKLYISGRFNGTVDDLVLHGVGPNNAIPTLSGLPDFTVIEDSASNLDLSGTTFADTDSSGDITVVLTVGEGTLSGSSDDGVVASGTNSAALTLVGTISELNAFFADATAVQYTSAADATGTNVTTLEITGNDGDGSGTVTLDTANISVTGTNDAPTNANSSVSVTESTTFTFGSGDFSFSDVDTGDTLTSVRIDTLPSAAVGVLKLSGTDVTAGDVIAVGDLANLTFVPETGVTTNASFTYSVSDGTAFAASPATMTLSLSAVNDDPTALGIPSTVTVAEDTATAIDLSDISFSDPDSGSADITLKLTADAGTLTASDADGVVVSGSGSGEITLTGTASEIDTFLNNASAISYTTASNAVGSVATITLTANDGGNTGTGGGSDVTFSQTIAVTSTAVNDDPTASGIPSTVTVAEDTATAIDLSAITFDDVDSGSADITLKLTADAGTMTASDADGVVVSGSGSGEITLTGTASEIDTFLNNASAISYTTAADATGAGVATITLSANDGGNTGTGGGTDVSLGSISVTSTNVNDDPTGTPQHTTQTTDVNTLFVLRSYIDGSGDIDSSTIEVTFTFSSGTATAASFGAVTVTGSGSNAVTFSGPVENVFGYIGGDPLTYTPATDFSGAVTVNVTADDGDGSGDVSLGAITITVAPPNDLPVISDLDGDSFTYVEGSGAQRLDQSTRATLDDNDATGYDGGNVTVAITSASSDETLAVDTSTDVTLGSGMTAGSVVTVSGTDIGTIVSGMTGVSSQSLQVSLNSNATDALIGTLMQNITYTNSSENPNGDRTVSFTVTDGDSGTSGTSEVTVTLSGVNDDPEATGLPATVTVVEDTATAIDLSAITFGDVDSDTADITLTLTADAGTMTASDAGGVVVSGSGGAAITLTGTADEIDTFLNNASAISYTTASNAAGADIATITLTANDGGNTGTGGGTDVSLGFISVTSTAVNDDPTASGVPATVTVVEDVATAIDLSAISFGDVDSDTADITLTLTADAGTLAASDAGGVVVSGSGGAAITLTGTASEIDTFLNNTSAISYTTASNAVGSNVASITLTANDGGNIGTGGGSDVSLGSISVTSTAVNDDPTASGVPGTVTVVEDTATAIDLSAISFGDVDSGSADITLTLTADAGTLAASDAGGVVVSGSGGAAITLTGTASEIDTFLNNTSAISYTTASNAVGTGVATITLTANDGGNTGTGGGSDISLGSISVTSTNVNDAPTSAGASLTLDEDTSLTFTAGNFAFADVDTGDALTSVRIDTLSLATGDTLRLSGVDVTAGDVIALASIGNLVYTPAANANGAARSSFTYSVNDGTAYAASPATMTLNVTDVAEPVTNRKPTNLHIDDTTIAQNEAGAAVGHLSATDADGDALTFTTTDGRFEIVSGNLLKLKSGIELDGTTEPTVSVAIRVSDGKGGLLSTTVTLSVVNPSTGGGSSSSDIVMGNDDADDTVDGASGDDSISGGGGNDRLKGGDGNDTLSGGNDDDNLRGNDGNDTLDGGNGQDTLRGGVGDDTVDGGNDDDLVYAGRGDEGDDFIIGGFGNDTLGGGRGNDTIEGDDGDDLIWGRFGDDQINGGAGDDILFNGTGNDTVDGGSGADTLWGCGGDDILTGGDGADVFAFKNATGNDTITDFDASEDGLSFDVSTGMASKAEVLAAATETTVNGQSGVLVDLGGGESIFLTGINLNELNDVTMTF